MSGMPLAQALVALCLPHRSHCADPGAARSRLSGDRRDRHGLRPRRRLLHGLCGQGVRRRLCAGDRLARTGDRRRRLCRRALRKQPAHPPGSPPKSALRPALRPARPRPAGAVRACRRARGFARDRVRAADAAPARHRRGHGVTAAARRRGGRARARAVRKPRACARLAGPDRGRRHPRRAVEPGRAVRRAARGAAGRAWAQPGRAGLRSPMPRRSANARTAPAAPKPAHGPPRCWWSRPPSRSRSSSCNRSATFRASRSAAAPRANW